MEKDILVILMIAFGLFAIIMFVLFYAYLKKYYNNKHIDDDYEKDIINEIEEENEASSNTYNVDESTVNSDINYEDGFIPIKKK